MAFPDYSLTEINRLEHLFLSLVEWRLFIHPETYSKYYFGLRKQTENDETTEKRTFRGRLFDMTFKGKHK
jgi:hypothetical protein